MAAKTHNTKHTFNNGLSTKYDEVLGLTGAVQPSRYVGGVASVAPTSGTFAVGDFVISQAGNIFVCTSAGTPGTWKSVRKSDIQVSIAAGSMWPSATSGAAFPTKTELATNKVNLYTLDYDSVAKEYAEFTTPTPPDWDGGTFLGTFFWTHPATVTNFGVRWGVQATAFGDGSALDAAYGTAQEVTDTGGTTNTHYISPTTAAVTPAGSPAAGQLLQVRVYRDPVNAADTMAVDAKLIAVRLDFSRA